MLSIYVGMLCCIGNEKKFKICLVLASRNDMDILYVQNYKQRAIFSFGNPGNQRI